MGYDINRFEGNVDDELICSICNGVLENPLQVVACEHVFCGDCINQWLDRGNKTCPLDREEIKRDDVKTPRIVTNLLAKLTVKCDFSSFGCPAMIKLETLTQHCSQCDFDPDKRVRCEKGCGQTLARNELLGHNCMEELHNLVRRQTEQIARQQKLIQELIMQVENLKENHAQITNDYVEIKQLMAKLEVKISNENKQSKLIKKGIVKCADIWKRLGDFDNNLDDVIGDRDNAKATRKCSKQIHVSFKGQQVEVNPYDLIINVKASLKSKLGIQNGKLKLFHGHQELTEQFTLEHYNLLQIENPEILVALCDEIQILIRVRMMNTTENIKHPWLSNSLPKTIALTVDRNQTIAQVKSEVQLICGFKRGNVLMSLGNQSLDDDRRVLDYRITSGDTINFYVHLV